MYECSICHELIGPFPVKPDLKGQQPSPSKCPHCQSSGPFPINSEQVFFSPSSLLIYSSFSISKTKHRNYQKVTLQESPGSVPPGRLPRSKDVILLDDLIDIAQPGDEIV